MVWNWRTFLNNDWQEDRRQCKAYVKSQHQFPVLTLQPRRSGCGTSSCTSMDKLQSTQWLPMRSSTTQTSEGDNEECTPHSRESQQARIAIRRITRSDCIVSWSIILIVIHWAVFGHGMPWDSVVGAFEPLSPSPFSSACTCWVFFCDILDHDVFVTPDMDNLVLRGFF